MTLANWCGFPQFLLSFKLVEQLKKQAYTFFARRCLPDLSRSHLALAMLSYEQQKSLKIAGRYEQVVIITRLLFLSRPLPQEIIVFHHHNRAIFLDIEPGLEK